MGSYILDQAHEVVSRHVFPGNVAIDATVGNGWDTVFLAHQVGRKGRVIGVDIQPGAIDSTRRRLEAEGVYDRCHLSVRSHEHLVAIVSEHSLPAPSVIMFNLGYLPGGAKDISTTKASTLVALEHALQVLASDGLITVVAYRGHPGAAEECDAVENWMNSLDPLQYTTSRIVDPEGPGHAPRLFVIKCVR